MRSSFAAPIIALACALLPIAVVHAQQGNAPSRASLQGRVTDALTGAHISGAAVVLGDGIARAITDANGAYRLTSAIGSYSLVYQSLGYSTVEQSISLMRDTVINVTMTPAALSMDTIQVRAREFMLRGTVADSTGFGLIDARVTLPNGKRDRTNAHGSFKFKLPAEQDAHLAITAFGYLPLDTALTLVGDTAVRATLRTDPIIRAMTMRQLALIDDRSRSLRFAGMPVMDRSTIMQFVNSTVLDMLKQYYGFSLDRVSCVVLDDHVSGAGLAPFVTLVPDKLERVEVLQRGTMMRIYTREYLRRLVSGGRRLPDLSHLDRNGSTCR